MATLYGGTLTNLLMGPAYIYYADAAVATRPTKIDDVIGMASPYTPKTNWIAIGATSDASGYSREFEQEDYEIEQRTGAVGSKVTSVSRSLTVPLSEITAALMRIVEAAPAPTTIVQGAAASGTPAQSRLDFGSISTLPRYRFALIAERDKGVTGSSGEGGARGQLAAILLYSASIAADASEMEIAKGQLVGREVTFTAYPDSAVTDPEKAHGAYVEETGATVP